MHDEIKNCLKIAFAEDLGDGDVTGNAIIPADSIGKYVFRTREEIIFCGQEAIKQGLSGLQIRILANDGQRLNAGEVIAEVEGNIRKILAAERVVLNLIQHLSAIASETAKYVEAVHGTKARILDTRKTTPGLRALEKYAVKCGGGENHRMGLYDMVMIKDNHIKAAGGITQAVSKARSTGLKIEVECDSLDQVREALAANADIIMADNMTLEQLKQAVAIIDGRVPLEASGNVSLQTVRAIAETGVDFISTSKITIAAKPVDIGLDEA